MRRNKSGVKVACFAACFLLNCSMRLNLRSVEDVLMGDIDKITVEYIFLNKGNKNGRAVLHKKVKWLLVKDAEVIGMMKSMFSEKKTSFPMKISDGEIKYYKKGEVVCKAMVYLERKYNCAAVRVGNNDYFCALTKSGRRLLVKYQNDVVERVGFQKNDTLIIQ